MTKETKAGSAPSTKGLQPIPPATPTSTGQSGSQTGSAQPAGGGGASDKNS